MGNQNDVEASMGQEPSVSNNMDAEASALNSASEAAKSNSASGVNGSVDAALGTAFGAAMLDPNVYPQ